MKYIKYAAFGIIAFILLLWIIEYGNEGSAALKKKNKSNVDPEKLIAYTMMENYVKGNLKAPTTAKFPPPSEKQKHIQKIAGTLYEIHSWVDSQNGFGALVRTPFSGKIKKNISGNWELVDLQFENKN